MTPPSRSNDGLLAFVICLSDGYKFASVLRYIGLVFILFISFTDPEAALHYGLALQEEKELHGDFIHQTPLSQKRSGLRNRSHMTRSLDNIHHHCQMSTVVPVSSMTKSSSQNDLSFNGYSPSSFSGEPSLMNGHIHRPHTPLNTQKGKPGGLWDSNDTTDEESGDRLFYKRPKSAMESAMEFSSIHDIHIASNNNSSMTFPPESDNESAVIPRRRSDVIMMQRGHDVEESLTKTSVHRDRSRSQHRYDRNKSESQYLFNFCTTACKLQSLILDVKYIICKVLRLSNGKQVDSSNCFRRCSQK